MADTDSVKKSNQNVPKHVALILDGNRRWARKKGLQVILGHRKSAEHVESLLDRLLEHGVNTTTLWVFSTENWKRDKAQVDGIMKLAAEFIERYKERVMRDKVRVIHLGRKDRIPAGVKQKLEEIEHMTKEFTGKYLNIALDYGGRDEIIRGIQKVQKAGIDAHTLTEENFNDYLDTHDQEFPEPDLIVRSGGALRMSGFMAWQGVYAEYAFVDKYFPDITVEDIDQLIENYGDRERRFGGGK